MTRLLRREHDSARSAPGPAGAWRKLFSHDHGATLVEFAVTSLLFFLIAFGTLEFSRMILDYNIVSWSAREGVRYASVRGATSGHAATTTDIQNYVVSRANGLLSASNVTVTWPLNNKTGSEVEVQVSYSFVPVVGMLPSAAINLSSTTRMFIVR